MGCKHAECICTVGLSGPSQSNGVSKLLVRQNVMDHTLIGIPMEHTIPHAVVANMLVYYLAGQRLLVYGQHWA